MPNQRVIPRPSADTVAKLQNTNKSCTLFLRAVRIKDGSEEHKQLKTTIHALHRQYLHPYKYLEEQAPERIDQLIAKARLSLPWLDNYEDGWPARIYLKRYVDGKRPHLKCSRYAHQKRLGVQRSQASHNVCMRNLEDSDDMQKDHDLTVKKFLGSMIPSLEQHLDAFAELGVKDQKTLHAFLSWPQAVQAEFLDEGHEVLQLTSLEKKALLVGCGLLTQRALQGSLLSTVQSLGHFHP